MKFVPKFQLVFLFYGKYLVPRGHDILLGLMSPFYMDQVAALINLVVKLSWWSIAMICAFWLTDHVNTLCHIIGAD
jgi:fatty-acid desaturase